MKKVSIIIPLYNAREYICECLESVINQTYKHTEIIVVDDGSTDGSSEFVEQYAGHLSLYRKENGGAATARNVGLSYATGDYIQFLDADDTLESDKISAQMKILAELGYPKDVVMSGRWTILGRCVDDMPDNQKTIWHNYPSPVDLLVDFNTIGCCYNPGVFLTHRNLIERAGGWDETLSLNDDGEFFARIFNVAKEIVFCDKAVMNYRHTENSLSKTKNTKAIWSQAHSIIKIAEIIANSNNPQKNVAIQKMLQGFLSCYFPYYLAQCRKVKAIAKVNYPEISLSYPKLTFKEWVYFYFMQIRALFV